MDHLQPGHLQGLIWGCEGVVRMHHFPVLKSLWTIGAANSTWRSCTLSPRVGLWNVLPAAHGTAILSFPCAPSLSSLAGREPH